MRVARYAGLAVAVLVMLAMPLSPGPVAAGPPSVIVSLPPLHSLVAAVMGDTGAPALVLRGGRSPHNTALRPSDLKRLREASIIVWVGPTLETYLTKPIAAVAKKATVITLLDLQWLKRLSRRAGGSWETHDHEAPHGLSDAVVDPHVWLSPANAVIIAEAVAATLTRLDPVNAASYKTNTKRLIARISVLEGRLRRSLEPLQGVPYLVFHDAYQYFERHFSLNAIGAISISPERRPGARRIAHIRRRIQQSSVRCIFREPQFPPRMLSTIVKGTAVRTGSLDPLGASITPGPNHWFMLMTSLGKGLSGCLGGSS